MEQKKPDSAVYKPGRGWVAGVLEYGTSVGGPPITVPDLSSKGRRLTDLAKHFKDRLDTLSIEYAKVLDDWETNRRLWEAELKVEPKPGEVYHLYSGNESEFLSIISPAEWGKEMGYAGTYVMRMDGRWEKI